MNVCMYVLQVFFTGHYLQDVQWQFRWAILVLLVHVVLALRSTIHTYIQYHSRAKLLFIVSLLCRYVLKESIDDVPSEVQMQLDR